MSENYESMSAAERMAADAAAEWFLQILVEAATLEGQPLTSEQKWILRHPVSDFTEDIREEVIATNNRCVELIRKIIRRDVAAGKPSMKVRPGLWVPNNLEEQYEFLYLTEHPWFICAVLQNVFLGNPMQGENGIWTPNNRPPSRGEQADQYKETAPKLSIADKDLLKQNSPKSNANVIWFISVLAALLLIVFVGCARGVSSNSEAAYVGTESADEPSDIGEAIPGDYYELDEFAWQWVSSPTCESGTICSQARVFSKYGCQYEVWIDWQRELVDNPSNFDRDRTAIPPMARGETAVVTLSSKSELFDYGIDYQDVINEIACGQTG